MQNKGVEKHGDGWETWDKDRVLTSCRMKQWNEFHQSILMHWRGLVKVHL